MIGQSAGREASLTPSANLQMMTEFQNGLGFRTLLYPALTVENSYETALIVWADTKPS